MGHTQAEPPFDVLVAGGGMVGLALATAVKEALGAGMRVGLADPALDSDVYGTRASALAAGPRRMLEQLGVWSAIEPSAQPMRAMIVTDSRAGDAIRPKFLEFGGEFEPGEPFAHMVMNADVVTALAARGRALGVETLRAAIVDFRNGVETIEATSDAGAHFPARLLVVADGRRSRLRDLAGVGMVGWDYGQAGIVATIGHERPHDGVARQHFLPAGPFAILPLKGERSSIVWNESVEDAKNICALDAEDFLAELQPRFGRELGALTLLDAPRWFPFGLRVARRFVDRRLALIGDAAHLVHPIAGQGLNFGLRDVAALAEQIVDAMRLGLDPGSPETLRGYERARRFDTLAMSAATDALNRLFSNDLPPLRALRDLGLGLVDRAPGLKRFFVRQAAGAEAGARLLRGEAL
jgi:2-octaprenyl-6-methoxyphenol hydroxylase